LTFLTIKKKEDIKWDSLTIANDGINLEFVVMRATMGKKRKINILTNFGKKRKKTNSLEALITFTEQTKTL
jgi:lysozyme